MSLEPHLYQIPGPDMYISGPQSVDYWKSEAADQISADGQCPDDEVGGSEKMHASYLDMVWYMVWYGCVYPSPLVPYPHHILNC